MTRTTVFAVFDTSVELERAITGSSSSRASVFMPADLGDLFLAAVAGFFTIHKLDVVDDDQAETVRAS